MANNQFYKSMKKLIKILGGTLVALLLLLLVLPGGALTVFIRTFGGYPEGASFSILIMNALVWYLDAAFRPRVFGKGKGKVARHEG